jgi:hypothetical protein
MFGNDFKITNYANGNLLLTTNSTERMRITSSGNVGIGTTTPGQKLEVDGNIIATPGNKIGFRYDNSNANLYGYITRSTSGGVAPLTIVGGLETLGNIEAIRFETANAGSVKMSILNNGFVGIGTTNPSTLLTVRGNGNNLITAQYNIDGGSAGIGFLNSAGTELWSIGGGRFVRQDEFAISRQGTTALYIDNNRNVGIGTSSPGVKLHVAGPEQLLDDGVSGRLTFGVASGQNDIYSTTTSFGAWQNLRYTANDHIFRNAGTEVMRLTGGNVGIGTTNPDVFSRGYGKILGLSGTGVVKMEINGSSYSGIDFGQSGTRTAEINSSTGSFEIGTVGAIPIYFTPNGTTQVAITAAGNVGIGNTSPTFKLSTYISTNSRNGHYIYGDNGGANESIGYRTENANGTGIFFGVNGYNYSSGIGVANESVLYGIGNVALIIGTNSTERMRITPTGNVGMGTSAPDPSAILELNSTTQGFLPPRMDNSEINAISNPAEGLIVYSTQSKCLFLFDGANWQKIAYA